MSDYFVIHDSFVLQYIIEPNKIVYFVSDGLDDKLHCVTSKYNALIFANRFECLNKVDFIKNKYGIEFQIVELD